MRFVVTKVAFARGRRMEPGDEFNAPDTFSASWCTRKDLIEDGEPAVVDEAEKEEAEIRQAVEALQGKAPDNFEDAKVENKPAPSPAKKKTSKKTSKKAAKKKAAG